MCLTLTTAHYLDVRAVKYLTFLKEQQQKKPKLYPSTCIVDDKELQIVVCRLKRSRVTAERKAGMLFWWCRWRATISPRVLENSVSISCMVPLELWVKCKNKNSQQSQTRFPSTATRTFEGKQDYLKLLSSEGNCQVCISVCCMCTRSQQEGGGLNLCGLIKRNEEQLGAMEWRRKGWGKWDKVIKAMQGGRKVARSRVPWHAEKILRHLRNVLCRLFQKNDLRSDKLWVMRKYSGMRSQNQFWT